MTSRGVGGREMGGIGMEEVVVKVVVRTARKREAEVGGGQLINSLVLYIRSPASFRQRLESVGI
jgi:hypothetical protein